MASHDLHVCMLPALMHALHGMEHPILFIWLAGWLTVTCDCTIVLKARELKTVWCVCALQRKRKRNGLLESRLFVLFCNILDSHIRRFQRYAMLLKQQQKKYVVCVCGVSTTHCTHTYVWPFSRNTIHLTPIYACQCIIHISICFILFIFMHLERPSSASVISTGQTSMRGSMPLAIPWRCRRRCAPAYHHHRQFAHRLLPHLVVAGC